MDQRTIRWVENEMDCHAESVVSRGRKSNCFLVTSGILQAPIVGPVLFTVGVPVFIPLSDLVSPDGPQTYLTALFQIMYLAASPGWTLHLVHHLSVLEADHKSC